MGSPSQHSREEAMTETVTLRRIDAKLVQLAERIFSMDYAQLRVLDRNLDAAQHHPSPYKRQASLDLVWQLLTAMEREAQQ